MREKLGMLLKWEDDAAFTVKPVTTVALRVITEITHNLPEL
ncbi:MAG: hypothetical protein ABJM58_03960 [Alteripontixanthobacter sp.]